MAPKQEKKQNDQVTLTYMIGEWPKCTRDNGGNFRLKSTVSLNLKPGATLLVNLGVRVDMPIMVFEANELLNLGVRVKEGLGIHDEGRPLSVLIENKGENTVPIDPGTTLAKFHVLQNRDLDVRK